MTPPTCDHPNVYWSLGGVRMCETCEEQAAGWVMCGSFGCSRRVPPDIARGQRALGVIHCATHCPAMCRCRWVRTPPARKVRIAQDTLEVQ